MISKHKFYLMWIIATAVLVIIGTCKIVEAKEITDTSVKHVIEQAIKSCGYTCPCISICWNKGMGPYGLIIKAYCGDCKGGTYPNLCYEVIYTNNAELYVKPWKKKGFEKFLF